MICLGNICRSPIAEAVMIDTIKKHNLSDKFTVDSAAIGKYLFLDILLIFNGISYNCRFMARRQGS